MRPFTQFRGLRFPDAALIRHFYRSGLDRSPGLVVELACGNGCNLQLFEAHGWSSIGVDISREVLAEARHNLGPRPLLVEHDLRDGIPGRFPVPMNALVMAYCLDYLSLSQARRLVGQLALVLAPGASVFIRSRGTSDARYGRGKPLSRDAFELASPQTGEVGVFQQFYRSNDLEALARQLGVVEPLILSDDFANPQGGGITHNSDWLVLGRTSEPKQAVP